jgi:hypothetical protein
VIPDTLAALLSLLGVVAPGLVFELRRERRHPAHNDSAFREASRTALSSLLFTSVVLILMGFVRLIWPSVVVDVGAWVEGGNAYFADHDVLIGINTAIAVLAAVALAVLAESIFGRNVAASIQPGHIWSYMFKTNRPRGTNNWVGVELTSGGRVFGYVDRYSAGLGTDEGELFVVGPGLTLVRPPREDADAQPEQLSLDGKWDGIHIRASEISSVRLHYKPKEPPEPSPPPRGRSIPRR